MHSKRLAEIELSITSIKEKRRMNDLNDSDYSVAVNDACKNMLLELYQEFFELVIAERELK